MKNQNKILLGIAAIFLVVIAAAALDVHAQYNQPSLPDLQTIDVGYGSTDYPLSVGDSIKEARFPITNAGGTSASNINYEISVYDTATTDISLCTKTGTYSGTIDPGVTIPSDNNIISISCPAFSYGGTYALRVRLDSNSKIAELNEGNNIAIKDFNVAGGIAVDYGIGVTVNGPGSVISNDGRINCGPKDVACFAFYSLGSTVTLNALPSTKGANFDGWSGACSGTGACFVTVSQAGPNSVTASFSGGTIIIEPTQPFNLDISTDKYYYTAGEQVKVSGILTSNNNLGIGDLGNADVKAVISYTPSCPTGMGCAAMLARLAEIQLKFVGAVAPACKVQEGGVTTCPAYAQYYYVGYYTPTFAGGKFFVDGTAIANGISATDSAQFETIGKQSGEEYDAVDLSISPEEQRTVVGESVTYLLTITDKHKKGEVRPVLCKTLLGQICPPPEAAQYIYNLELFGLPYPSSFSQSSVTLSAGQSTDVRLIVYPSSTAIQQQVVTATAVPVEPQQTVTEPAAPTVRPQTEPVAERMITKVTGQLTRESFFPSSGGTSGGVAKESTTVIAKESATKTVIATDETYQSTVRFTVKASQSDNDRNSDKANAILHVYYYNPPAPPEEPPDLPEYESVTLAFEKGWNLINLPGEFVQSRESSSCGDFSGFAYFPGRGYATLEKSRDIIGDDNEYISYFSTHSFWVRARQACKITVEVSNFATYSGLELSKGWNFLGTTKDMVGETLDNIKGTCPIEKAYTFNTAANKWNKLGTANLITTPYKGIVVKTSGECTLGENTILPPPLPDEEPQTEPTPIVKIKNAKECVKKGGAVAEKAPPVCIINGKTYKIEEW